MEVFREASPFERGYIECNTALYFYFTINERFDAIAYEHAIAIILRRHPFLRAALNDTVFIEKDGLHPQKHLTECKELPQGGKQFDYALDNNSLFHLYIAEQSDGSTKCLLVLHHAIGDVTAGASLIEDLVKGLLSPQTPQNPLPLHHSIEAFFPHNPVDEEITRYAEGYHNTHPYPATCTLPIINPEVPYEQTHLEERVVTIRQDIYKHLRDTAKSQHVSKHALLTAILLHSIPDEIDKKSVCIGTVVDLKRRLLESSGQKDLFAGPVLTTTFIDLNGHDPYYETAKKYACALAAKIQTPDFYRECYGILEEKINLFLLGMSFLISDSGKIQFSSSTVQELITEFSFTTPFRLNCPSITSTTYDNTVTLRICFPAPWMSDAIFTSYMRRLSQSLRDFL